MGVTERLARARAGIRGGCCSAGSARSWSRLGLAAAFLPGNLTTNGHSPATRASQQAERIFFRQFPPDRNAASTS